MTRAKKRAERAPARVDTSAATTPEPGVPPAHRGDLASGLAWLGWTLVALTAPVAALVDAGSIASYVASGLAGAGGLLVVASVALRVRDRDAAPMSAWFPAGTALLVGGAGALVYPCFASRADIAALHERFPFAPLAAVAFVLAGIALSLIGLHRQGTGEPPFSPEEEAKYATWWPRVRLVLPPWGLYYLPLFLWESWRELDREAAREREARAAAGHTGYDWRPLAVFCAGAVCLALMEYFGHAPTFREIVDYFDPPGRMEEASSFFAVVRESPFRRLTEFVWWSGWRVLGFFLLPAIVVKLVLRERLADYGLATAGFLKHAWIYALFFAIVLVAVVVVSYEDSFKTYYPFYRDASRSWFDFWAWELLYAAQFFSLEFFFRGFWLEAAKRSMGSHAIFAMVVPYCMIHFGKPFLETLAAILAGVVLGTLALRTRSIWSGFLIHVTVAVSMDVAALLQTAGLPDRWWPAL